MPDSVCIVSIIRATTLLKGMQVKDSTYNGVTTYMWTAIESNVGIICACLPVLRPILQQLIPWFLERTGRTSKNRRTYDPYGDSAEVAQQPSKKSYHRNSDLQYWAKGDNVIISHISSRHPQSRHSSEVCLNEGILRKTEVETSVESMKDHELSKEDFQPTEPERVHIV
jgi:hypothetical protein